MAAATLAACSTTSGHRPTVNQSGFDGSKVVDIDPHGGMCPKITQTCIGLGAQWSSAHAETAILRVELIGEYLNIQSVELNIDGVTTQVEPTNTTTDFNNETGVLRTSDRSFVASLATIRSMAAAKRVWVRAMTDKGYVENGIVDASGDSKAYNALKRFMAEVDVTRVTR
ncbi:hypothetical protein [Rhodanobacter sp. BL-MT-08]